MCNKMKYAMLGVTLFSIASANAGSIRATQMTPKLWRAIEAGETSDSVEFRSGDRLSVFVKAEGDFIETISNQESTLLVKRNFWLKFSGNSMTVSLDGESFRPLKDVMTGSLSASFGSSEQNGVASSIDVVLKAMLK